MHKSNLPGEKLHYDVLIIGGGIAGMESAVTLGDMGYSVLLVEKESSIGGKMILLSKVFPTLDCSSCISTPKMAAAASHPNVKILTYSEVKKVEPGAVGSGFTVTLQKKPSFVDPDRCTGCGQCEVSCTVSMPDQFNCNLVPRRAAYIAFPQAVPKKAVIEHYGSSPCTYACPAGIHAHGIVSLVRAGRYREAFRLHMEDSPLPGVLSRLCAAPCERGCTRSKVESAVPIRAIKKFVVDRYYNEFPRPETQPSGDGTGKRVAVIGSGPDSLSTAYFLAREGHAVSVFDSGERPGGILRYGVSEDVLPPSLLDRDISEIESIGVEIRSGEETKSLEYFRQEGFDAVFVGAGAVPEDMVSDETGEDSATRSGAVPFQTPDPWIFAARGEPPSPEMVAKAIAGGKKAAFYINGFLQGRIPEKDIRSDRLPPVKHRQVLERYPDGFPPGPFLNKESARQPHAGCPDVPGAKDARLRAAGCLDCGGCSECNECVNVCPANAVDFGARPEDLEVEARAVLLATGFSLFDAGKKEAFGYGRFPNVVDAMQMDRILAPTRPYNSVLRPSDGKVPSNIAFILCTGSRDEAAGNRICSRVCCMYSAKQAQLIMGALPIADVTIYYIDIRAFGKGYEEFYEQAGQMGVYFVKGKAARIEETETQDLIIHYEDMEGDGRVKQAEHDLVVLSVGLLANTEALKPFEAIGLEKDPFAFVREPDSALEPGRTAVPGIFVAGSAAAVRDIPDTVLHSGAAAAQIAGYLSRGDEVTDHVLR